MSNRKRISDGPENGFSQNPDQTEPISKINSASLENAWMLLSHSEFYSMVER